MEDINKYIRSWTQFRSKCEKKVKNRCHINSKGWRKLREFHMEGWLKKHPSPFGFMFKMKYKYPMIYNSISCSSKFYYLTKKWRDNKFNNEVCRNTILFPKWRVFYNNRVNK